MLRVSETAGTKFVREPAVNQGGADESSFSARRFGRRLLIAGPA